MPEKNIPYFFLRPAPTLPLRVDGVPAAPAVPINVTGSFLKAFSEAWIFPPVLQAKLEINRWASALHFGQEGLLADSLNARLNSNSVLHCGQ